MPIVPKTTEDKLKKTILDLVFRPVDIDEDGLEPDVMFHLGDSPSLFCPSANGPYQQGDPDIQIYKDAVFWPSQSVVQRRGKLGRRTFLDDGRREQLRDLSSLRNYPLIRWPGWATSIEFLYPTSNYYHFFVDALPRVWALNHPRLRDLPIQIFYTRNMVHEWRTILGDMLPRNVTLRKVRRLCRVSADYYVHLPYLSKPRVQPADENAPTSAGFIPGEYLDAFRRCVFERYDIKPPASPVRRLYVTRRNATQRRVLNEAEVLDLLQPLGFEVVALEGSSLRAQADLFASAQMVVAQHGAALTNLMYMKKGGSVLEIFSSQQFFPYYARYAESAGIHYERLHLDRGWKNADVDVPIDQLRHAVSRCLAGVRFSFDFATATRQPARHERNR